MSTGQNPWRYRVYVVRYNASGEELRKEFLAGKRVYDEALRARDDHDRTMTRQSGVTDANGEWVRVEVRDEPYPEFPDS